MTNTLAYYDMATITAVKSFIVQAPGAKHELLFNKLASAYLVKVKNVSMRTRSHIAGEMGVRQGAGSGGAVQARKR